MTSKNEDCRGPCSCHRRRRFPGEALYRVLPPCPCPGRRPPGRLPGRGGPARVRKTGLDQAIYGLWLRGGSRGPFAIPARPSWTSPWRSHWARAASRTLRCLRCEPAVFGPVASDPTISRLIDTLAASGDKALHAIRSARSEVRHRAWPLAGKKAPDADGGRHRSRRRPRNRHFDEEDAAATWKKTYGHHPLTAFLDHGPGGTGEPLAALLRPGNAGSNTAADHITTAQLALAQLPRHYRRGRQTLIRTDSAGGTHDFVSWLAERGRWLSYSVRMVITEAIHEHVLKVPASPTGGSTEARPPTHRHAEP
ncbi:transposase [Streptomyces sp. NPDC091290]|uniref:transposase n=1 Tax=Streptomyces sp. NPDC091290 TaxID=3365990 RepID=UPI0038273BD9